MERKTDRRSVYTQAVIKDSFLTLLQERPFSKINITAICKQAEITRATFYLHYMDIYDLLDQLLDEALNATDSENAGDTWKIMNAVLQADDPIQFVKDHVQELPLCQRLARSEKYKPLFTDETLNTYVLRHLIKTRKEPLLKSMETEFHIPRSLAESLYLFIITGSFAVNQEHHWKENKAWYQTQAMMLRFIAYGMKSFQK